MKITTHHHQTPQLAPQLWLSPSMRVALHILQMPLVELKVFLEQQLQANPFLELGAEAQDGLPADESDASPAEDQRDETLGFSGLDENMQEALRQAGSPSPNGDTEDDTVPLIERHPDAPPSLSDSLRLQLGCLVHGEAERALGELLIDHLDEHGYLATPVEELAQQAQVSPEELKRILGILQICDPSGVGARNLQECLLIQLRHHGHADSLATRVVRDHFPLLLQRNLRRLASLCQCPQEELTAAYQTIQQLQPKPYRAPSLGDTQLLVPDLVVSKERAQYDVELVEERLPVLRLSRVYRQMLHDPDAPADAKQFLKDRLRQAMWLIRAVEQRHATLVAIARCLLAMQRDFLEEGPQALKPLTHAQVAQAIGRHPSTVGRAIAGKCIQTPYGILPLERFFASRVPQHAPNQAVSDATIKAQLQALIAQEDPSHPFSDDALAGQLRHRGLSVARRTVAKYRTALKILPAYLRRQQALATTADTRR